MKDKNKKIPVYDLLITETYRVGIKGAEDQDQAERGWYNGEEDRFVYGKIYEDVVEDVGLRWVDVDDD
tara:strand:- start:363 stop:566 length:204 start_codon:yes stop_codon:yes gene_type:complete